MKNTWKQASQSRLSRVLIMAIFPLLLTLALLIGCANPPVITAPALVAGSEVTIDGTTKGYALAVSLSIQNNDWKLLDSLLAPDFSYSGDGLNYTRDEYIGFM